jgi:TPR repeat protein
MKLVAVSLVLLFTAMLYSAGVQAGYAGGNGVLYRLNDPRPLYDAQARPDTARILEVLYHQGLRDFYDGEHHSAKTLLDPLARAGHAGAQYHLAMLYDTGSGVQQNSAAAVHWYGKAAVQGHVEAQYNLGVAYSNGEGVASNPVKAVYWWRKAARQGNVDAQFNLGVAFSNGQGIPVNYLEAARWWMHAAKQGDDVAQFNLGTLYLHGNGVDVNPQQAAKWWRRSADSGNERARIALRQLLGALKKANQPIQTD